MYFSPVHPVQGGAAVVTSCAISAAMVAEPIFDLTVVLNACIAQNSLSQAELICSIKCESSHSACQIRSKLSAAVGAECLACMKTS